MRNNARRRFEEGHFSSAAVDETLQNLTTRYVPLGEFLSCNGIRIFSSIEACYQS